MARTKSYALRILKAVSALPKDQTAALLGKQLLRSGTSVGANYRAACRAKSGPDFINKLKIVEEEGDESLYWMELLTESGMVSRSRLDALMKEGDEILSIIVASIKRNRATQSS